MSKATLLAFAVLLAGLGLSGCGGGSAEEAGGENIPPSTPSGLTASAVSPSQINLSWSASTDNVAVTGYRIYRSGTLMIALGNVTIYQDTSLTPSTAYSYTVQAMDPSGNASGQSTAAIVTTPATLDTTTPSTPTGLTANVISASQINLGWSASTDNVAVTGYNIYRGGTLLIALGNVTTYQNTGLIAATTYSYTVRAFDAAGNVSAQSSSASSTTQAAADTATPSIPTGLTATAASSSRINLSWTAATDNVGVTGYNVYRGGVQVATLGAVTTFQNTGLTGSTNYSYTVRAFDAAGNASGQSTAASATTPATLDITAPSTPTGLTANAVSPSQINLSWSASTDNVGVMGYRVFRGGTLLITLGNVTTYQNVGLTAATTYSYTVQAVDAAGNASSQSTAATRTTPAAPDTTAPTTPAGLTANAISASQINLSWSASTDNVAVTGYRIYRNGVFLTALGNVTTYQSTGLTASTTYSYNVDAIDAAGNASGTSTAASAATQAPNPTTILAWDAVSHPSLSGYRVYYGTTPGTYIQARGQGIAVGNVTTHTVIGLGSGTRYYFAVTAFDTSNNESTYSNEVFKDIP